MENIKIGSRVRISSGNYILDGMVVGTYNAEINDSIRFGYIVQIGYVDLIQDANEYCSGTKIGTLSIIPVDLDSIVQVL